MDLEDSLATFDVRRVHDDPSVESSRAEQRGVEDVGSVGSRDQDHALVGFKTVHLN